MSEHAHDSSFPRKPLIAVAALLSATLLLVAVTRTTGVGELRTPQMAVVMERQLRFQDQKDGSISVHDALTGEALDQVAPGSNGFLRGTLRGLSRERKRQGIGPEPAFRVSGRSDGRLLLEDPSTGRLVDLGSFGPTNAAVFLRLLMQAPKATANAALPASGTPAQAVQTPRSS